TAAVRGAAEATRAALSELSVRGAWEDLFRGPGKARLEELLPAFLQRQPWFNGDRRAVKSATLREAFRMRYGEATAFITLAEAEFDSAEPQTFLLPLTAFQGEAAERLLHEAPALALARLRGAEEGLLGDALADRAFCTSLVDAVAAGKTYRLGGGELVAWGAPGLAEALGPADGPLPVTL